MEFEFPIPEASKLSGGGGEDCSSFVKQSEGADGNACASRVGKEALAG
jgi:hypothetical protein